MTIKRKEIMEEEIVCNRERDLADERITITNIKISSSSGQERWIIRQVIVFHVRYDWRMKPFFDLIHESWIRG